MGTSAARQCMGPAAWLHVACASPGEHGARLERRAADGRRALLVEAGGGAQLASHLLLAEDGNAACQDVAVFEGRVEAMEWQGADLLLAFAAGNARRVFSVFPGMRLREAAGPGGSTASGLRWLRVSTRRSRR